MCSTMGKLLVYFAYTSTWTTQRRGAKGIEEVEWMKDEWLPTTELTGFMINGSHEIMEVDEEIARSKFPKAFDGNEGTK